MGFQTSPEPPPACRSRYGDGLEVEFGIASIDWALAPGTETVSHGERRRQVAVVGSTSEFLEVRRLTLARGRFLPHGEVVRGPAVAVLGATVARAALASSAAAG